MRHVIGATHAGKKADIWAIGALLYELASLRPLYQEGKERQPLLALYKMILSPLLPSMTVTFSQ
jgi:serine/threonine protein kinase